MLKRLFFGLSLHAPWPEEFPKGRVLEELDRHLTFIFLGNVSFENLEIPTPKFKVGIVGKFDQLIFLPKAKPHCVSWHVEWLEEITPWIEYRSFLIHWLQEKGFSCDQRKWLPHMTIARSPFDEKGWKEEFKTLPLSITSLNLYESLGNSRYKAIWTYPFIPPYLELSHTADIAYEVSGKNFETLFLHGAIALAQSYPPLLNYLNTHQKMESLEDVVIGLNEIITKVDSEEGSPFKAVSFHGKVIEHPKDVLKWEMIIDV